MVPLVIPLVPMVMPMVPFALPMVLLVPLATNGTIGKITNGTIGRTPNRATIHNKQGLFDPAGPYEHPKLRAVMCFNAPVVVYRATKAFMVLPMVPMVYQYRIKFYQWYHW